MDLQQVSAVMEKLTIRKLSQTETTVYAEKPKSKQRTNTEVKIHGKDVNFPVFQMDILPIQIKHFLHPGEQNLPL